MRTTERQTRDHEPSVDEMRDDLAEQMAMNMDVSDIMVLLLDGCIGLNETSDIEIKDEYRELFGEN